LLAQIRAKLEHYLLNETKEMSFSFGDRGEVSEVPLSGTHRDCSATGTGFSATKLHEEIFGNF
jgi:hypothetical protein